MDYSIILYVLLGILPSLAWLFYYLTKDLHPEPKRMIMRVFLWGAFITIPVFFVQVGLTKLLDISGIDSSTSPILYNLIYWFVIIAFSEEFFKYLVFKVKVSNSPHLDEPLDVMLYMVVGALGFAAVENILYILPTIGQMSLGEALVIDLIRSIGAVFLHTLCSGVIGYYLAMSFYKARKKGLTVMFGILVATLLHGVFDFSIMMLDGFIKYAIPVVIILTLAFLVFSGFGKLRKMKSICKIN